MPDPDIPTAPSVQADPFDLKEPSNQKASPDSKIVVEMETNRRHVHNSASVLRFRVTNKQEAACDVTIRMRLHGQNTEVRQDEDQIERCCRFEEQSDQEEFSFPFCGLRSGDILVQELRIAITRPDQPDHASVFEPRGGSLLVHVAEPPKAAAPGVVIDGINFNVSQTEAYGNTAENHFNLHLGQETPKPQAESEEPEWRPVRLRYAAQTLPEKLDLTLPGGVPLELVRISAGEFTMGGSEDQGKENERPAHSVCIDRDFYLGRFPVTQEQYTAVMNRNPSKSPTLPTSPSHPVENVSWEQAREFCRTLRALLTRTPEIPAHTSLAVDDLTLPSEAQWEYACRAGTETDYSFGDGRERLVDHGWFSKNAQGATHPVGRLKPNPWGLYDMHGNVWEWCEDPYTDDYTSAPPGNSAEPRQSDRHVLRGGSWNCYARDCRSATRHSAGAIEQTVNYGFRIVVYVKPVS